MHLKFVPDWHNGWRWFSVHCMALSAAVQGAMMAFPGILQQYVPAIIWQILAIFLLVVGVFGRLIDQKGSPDVHNPS